MMFPHSDSRKLSDNIPEQAEDEISEEKQTDDEDNNGK